MNGCAISQDFTAYLESKKHFSEQTLKCYQADLQCFIRFLKSKAGRCAISRPLHTLTDQAHQTAPTTTTAPDTTAERLLLAANGADMTAYLACLEKMNYSKSTIARKLSCLRTFYRFLIKRHCLRANPAMGVCPPKQEKKTPRFLEKQQVQELLNAGATDGWLGVRNKAILQTLYSAGLKVSELVGLNLADVDFPASVIHIRTAGRKQRVVPLEPYALAGVKRYIELRNQRSQIKGNFDSQALFVNRMGRRLNPRTVRREMQQHLVRAGLDRSFSPRSLRHSFAAHKLSAGSDLQSLRSLLGYLSSSSIRVYAHL